jgi:hypothetical protein
MLRTLAAFCVAPFPEALVQSVVVGLWRKPRPGIFANPASMFVVAVCLFRLRGPRPAGLVSCIIAISVPRPRTPQCRRPLLEA